MAILKEIGKERGFNTSFYCLNMKRIKSSLFKHDISVDKHIIIWPLAEMIDGRYLLIVDLVHREAKVEQTVKVAIIF